MTETIITRDDGVVTLTFNRPEKKNALTAANWQDLDRTVQEVAANPADRVLVITGAGGNFSSGANLSGGLGPAAGEAAPQEAKSGLTGAPPQGVIHDMRVVGELIGRLQRLPKPTIALVDGVCVGVGFGVAMACDLVLSSDRARFILAFVKRGLALDGGASWSLPRAVGLRRAKQMAFFGEPVSSAQALDWGLVTEVVPADDLERIGGEWARRLAASPTTAIGLIKRQLDSSFGASFEEQVEGEARAQHVAFTTTDMQEGIRAFLERREPKFTGS
jgi:2-(1,2-epoxy-1,2-dihydrophenyl)acetyl-CoA isomerase